MAKTNNWRDVLPLEDTGKISLNTLNNINSKLTSLLQRTPEVDVNVQLDTTLLTEKNPLSEDRSYKSAFRWTLQTKFREFSNWVIAHLDANIVEYGQAFIECFGDGSRCVSYNAQLQTVAFVRPKDGLPFFVLRDWLNLFDPSNFLFDLTQIDSHSDGPGDYWRLSFSKPAGRGFSKRDMERIAYYITHWGRPFGELAPDDVNMLAPQCTLAGIYKDFQANEHNFQYARMHSRDYLKQYIAYTMQRWSEERTDIDFGFQDFEIGAWFRRVLAYPYQHSMLFSSQERLDWADFMRSNWTYDRVEGFLQSPLYDSAAVNLDQNPQTAYFELFVFYFFDLYMQNI